MRGTLFLRGVGTRAKGSMARRGGATRSLKPVRSVALVALLAAGLILNTPAPGLPYQGPANLAELQQRMLGLFEVEGVVFIDADETNGRLVVGVQNVAWQDQINQRLTRLAVPLDLVVIEETKPIVLATTLRDNVRPLEGGLQIAFSQYLCTLGFNATRGGMSGFVVASHCTDNWGGIDGTNHYQPTVAEGNHIGIETYDVAFSKCSAYINLRKCRYSDSAFSQRDGDVTAALGFIEQTTGPNNGSLDIAGDFRITAEATGCNHGDTQNKVGRTTGWTQGVVTNSCVHVRVAGSGKVFLNQVLVEAGVAAGDSSSPVFRISNPSTGDVELSGILWGGTTDGSAFVYSPIANVESELGSLTTCASGSC